MFSNMQPPDPSLTFRVVISQSFAERDHLSGAIQFFNNLPAAKLQGPSELISKFRH